jgi:hypothetical protein
MGKMSGAAMSAAEARGMEYDRSFDVVEFVDDFDNLWRLFDNGDFRPYCRGRFDRRGSRDKIACYLADNGFGPICRQR